MSKQVALKELKENLSRFAEEAASGEVVEITRYNRPYIALVPCENAGLHVGKDVGHAHLVAVLPKPLSVSPLKYLEDDRSERCS